MPVHVVEVLEPVNTHGQRRGRQLASTTPNQHLLGTVDYERTVGKPGEHIVKRHVLQLPGLLLGLVKSTAPRNDQKAKYEEQDQCDEGDGASDGEPLGPPGGRAGRHRLVGR